MQIQCFAPVSPPTHARTRTHPWTGLGWSVLGSHSGSPDTERRSTPRGHKESRTALRGGGGVLLPTRQGDGMG